MPTTCLLVDDEPLALQVLRAHLDPLRTVEVVGTCPTALDAFERLRRQPVDLLFLDIQMPQLSGLDLLRALDDPPAVIITTAFRDYAVEGFELDVVDYLLKPVALPRLLKALDKYHARQAAPAPAPPPGGRSLDVRTGRRVVRVPLAAILYAESMGDYVKLHRTEGRPLVMKERLHRLEEQLAPAGFLRVHRSYLVAEGHVTAFTPESVQLGPHAVPISRSYRQRVLGRLGGS